MPRITTFTYVSLDGVMQSPARPDEDCRDGFDRGGWAASFGDAVLGHAIGESMSRSGALLLGRRTYEDFYRVWPNRKDNPFTPVLNNTLKYVASRTRQDPLPWMNSRLLCGDAEDAVATLRAEPGDDIVILGSGLLVQSLLRARLIDELMLMVCPIVLGAGRRLFPADAPPSSLHLVDSRTTSKGVLVSRYRTAAAD